jgi:hypothetical protein
LWDEAPSSATCSEGPWVVITPNYWKKHGRMEIQSPQLESMIRSYPNSRHSPEWWIGSRLLWNIGKNYIVQICCLLRDEVPWSIY